MQADRTNWPSQDHDPIVKKSAAPCRSIIHHDTARRKPGFTNNPTLFRRYRGVLAHRGGGGGGGGGDGGLGAGLRLRPFLLAPMQLTAHDEAYWLDTFAQAQPASSSAIRRHI
ncbi:hypothetical protein IF1G_10299 [Cordyceps javanica]|uniref:Uncharacterized protein n=1 Tax=Cordyceps javanica TaxID=43265 RepID=A0A545UNM7_9HYPO|nr:hypothetical protein IF1G_10299 [Cordyceps javanica]TQW02815.1 hypothetical protein IF2G_09697 [Cordyceps javanica]